MSEKLKYDPFPLTGGAGGNRIRSQEEAESKLGMIEVEPLDAVAPAPQTAPAPQGNPMDAVQPSVTPTPDLSEFAAQGEVLQQQPQQPQQNDGWQEIEIDGQSYSVQALSPEEEAEWMAQQQPQQAQQQPQQAQQHPQQAQQHPGGIPLGFGMGNTQDVPLQGPPQQGPPQQGPTLVPGPGGRGTFVMPPERAGGRPYEMYYEGVGLVSLVPGSTNGSVIRPEEGSGFNVGDNYNAPQGVKAEKGRRVIRDEEGNPRLALIKGSEEWTQVQNMQKVSQTMAGTVVTDSRDAMQILHDSQRLAGGWGAALSLLPESAAKDMAVKIDSVKSNIGFDMLMTIKSTGAGLGHVPQQQLITLQSVLGNMDRAQSLGQLQFALSRVESIYWWIASPEDFIRHATPDDYLRAGLSPEEALKELKEAELNEISTGRGASFARDAPKPKARDLGEEAGEKPKKEKDNRGVFTRWLGGRD